MNSSRSEQSLVKGALTGACERLAKAGACPALAPLARYVLVGAIVLVAADARAAVYDVFDLGVSLNWDKSTAVAISNADPVQVAVNSQSYPNNNAYLVTADGSPPLDIPQIPGGWFGHAGIDLNDSGHVVGWDGETSTAGVTHAFLYDGTTTADLNDLLSAGSDWMRLEQATGINNQGQITGWGRNLANQIRSFRIDGTSVRDLGVLTGPYIGAPQAYAINDSGYVVGETGWTGHAFLYTGGETPLDLGFSGDEAWPYSGAHDISDLGQVVGWTTSWWSQNHAFLITPQDSDGDGLPDTWFVDAGNGKNALMQDLGTLQGFGSGVGTAEAMAVNNAGQIVGKSTHPGNPGDLLDMHAFLWTPGGGMQDLNDLIPAGSGWVLRQALDINDSGIIVGVGSYTASPTIQPRAFMLVASQPHVIPEPTSIAVWTLLALGGLCIAWARRGHRPDRTAG